MRTIKKLLLMILSWGESLFYLLYWFIAHSYKSDFKNHLINNGKGKTIDVIVNGPSFAKQVELVKNDGYDKCMVNFAANTPIFWDLRPSFYCVSDPAFFENCNSLRKDEVVRFIDNIKKVDWNMTFFVRYEDYCHHIKNTELDNLQSINFVPFHCTSFPYSFKFRRIAFWLFKKGQAMPSPMSVSVPVIMNVINSGFSYINLYGYDQDWIHNIWVNKDNQVCQRDTHFYNEKGIAYIWRKNEKETFKMHELLQTQVELFEAYWFIREYIVYLGNVKIVNKSPTSLLDAFDRK